MNEMVYNNAMQWAWIYNKKLSGVQWNSKIHYFPSLLINMGQKKIDVSEWEEMKGFISITCQVTISQNKTPWTMDLSCFITTTRITSNATIQFPEWKM